MAWGRGRSKFEFAERRGDVLLLEREVPLGRIEGQVVDEQGTIKQGASVHIRLADEPSQYFGLLTDEQGRYALSLPVGHYQVEWGVQYRQRKAVEVKAGETVIQNGTRHAWRNPSSEPCQIIGLLVGAERSY